MSDKQLENCIFQTQITYFSAFFTQTQGQDLTTLPLYLRVYRKSEHVSSFNKNYFKGLFF